VDPHVLTARHLSPPQQRVQSASQLVTAIITEIQDAYAEFRTQINGASLGMPLVGIRSCTPLELGVDSVPPS
jgi:hypothetical protein